MPLSAAHNLKAPGFAGGWLLVLVTITVICSSTGSAQVVRMQRLPANEIDDTTSFVETGHIIYSLQTGRIIGGYDFTFQLLGVGGPGVTVACVPESSSGIVPIQSCGDGGHTHTELGPPARPFIYDRPTDQTDGQLVYTADQNPEPLMVTGETSAFGRGVRWEVPQVGGIYGFTSTVLAESGQFFFPFEKTKTYAGYVDVTQPRRSLPQLPDRPDLYTKARNPDMSHFDNVAFAADPLTHTALRLIAEGLPFWSGRKLSVNDISLPKGGVFDLSDRWTTLGVGGEPQFSHRSHREGLDVDINPLGIPCLSDYELQYTVDAFLQKFAGPPLDPNSNYSRFNGSALLCEPGGRKHIDITGLTFGP